MPGELCATALGSGHPASSGLIKVSLRERSDYNVLLAMKEKEVRALIDQFLRTTARRMVVPASLGLGLTASGCDSNALHAGVVDAGRDVAAQVSDVAVATSDVASSPKDANDATSAADLPFMAIPYIVALPPDASPLAPSPDAYESEAGAQGPDASPDAYVPLPPLIYIVFMQPANATPTASDQAAAPPAPQQKA